MSGLHVQVSGCGPDVVLLHGWGFNSTVWDAMDACVDGRVRLHRIDLPGHGASPEPRCVDLETVIGDLLHAAPTRAVWAGWSLGGMLALAVAARAPARVGALMMIAASPRFTVDADWPHATPLPVFEQFGRDLAADYRRTLGRFLVLQTRGGAAAGKTLCALRSGIEQAPPTPAGLSWGLEMLGRLDLRDELAGLRMPVMAVLGARDTLVPAAAGKDMGKLNPGLDVVVVPGAGHAPLLSDACRCGEGLLNLCELAEEAI